jgi:hypothetical protein
MGRLFELPNGHPKPYGGGYWDQFPEVVRLFAF